MNFTGDTIYVEVKLSDTVEELKKKIHEKINIPPEQQRLIFNGDQLDDDQELSYYNIKNESMIHLIICLSSSINVQVKCPSGKIITLKAEPSDKIKDLKSKIEEKENIPSDHQCLIIDGDQLEDDRKISDYNIKNKSMLQLISNYSDSIQVQVKSYIGKTITINIKLSDTVKILKKKIEEKEGTQQSILLFCGKELEDKNTLQYYNIQRNSTITSVGRFLGGVMSLFI